MTLVRRDEQHHAAPTRYCPARGTGRAEVFAGRTPMLRRETPPMNAASSSTKPTDRPRRIEIIARGLLLDGSRVLLCRNVEAGYFYLPGGHVEFGEPAAKAVEREFHEECAVVVRAGSCALVTEESFAARGKQHHEINVVFHVEQISQSPERERGVSGGLPSPRVSPQIISREPEIAFEWVELAAIVQTDLRPPTIHAWLASGGLVQDRTQNPGWVSNISSPASSA